MEKKNYWKVVCGVLVAVVALAAVAFGVANKDKDKVVYTQTYESADGWKLSYNPEKIIVNDLGNGEICFNYTGKASGTNAVIVSYHKDKMPDELLYERVGDMPEGTVERGESRFGVGGYASHYREIILPNENPEARDVSHESLTAIEHNGGTILVDCIDHYEKNSKRRSDKDSTFSIMLGTFDLLNHEPQTEYEYIYGTYERDYSEMVDGKTVERKETIVMNEDHTCVVTLEKTSNGDWTGTEILLEDGTVYNYNVEGDSLYLNNNNQWDEYSRK